MCVRPRGRRILMRLMQGLWCNQQAKFDTDKEGATQPDHIKSSLKLWRCEEDQPTILHTIWAAYCIIIAVATVIIVSGRGALNGVSLSLDSLTTWISFFLSSSSETRDRWGADMALYVAVPTTTIWCQPWLFNVARIQWAVCWATYQIQLFESIGITVMLQPKHIYKNFEI